MIKLIITDFDGTLVDTFEANYRAYERAFAAVGLSLTRERYRECFGFRFDRFMATMGIVDTQISSRIKELKSEYYPRFFEHLQVNGALLGFIRMFRAGGGKTAVASTARRRNLENALKHIGALNDFDLILAGEDVINGKPSPEIYNTVISRLGATPGETLIFEDSPVGLQAAHSADANVIQIQTTN